MTDDKKNKEGAPKADAPKEAAAKTPSPKAPAAEPYRITPKSAWYGAWKKSAAVGAIGLAGAAYAYYQGDPKRFAFSYLFGLTVWLSLALGSLFFVMILYVTKAGWGVSVRRTAEMFKRPMAMFAILVIPLVWMPVRNSPMTLLFPWEEGAKHEEAKKESKEAGGKPPSPLEGARGVAEKEPAAMRDVPVAQAKRMEKAEEKAESDIVNHKRLYLNRRFFLGRLIFYLLVWSWLAQRYFRWSTDQDKTKAAENTAAAQRFAPAGLILFALTSTFFAFDWLLSLDATWYSTIFGVWFFASSSLFQISALILMTLALRRSGLLGDTVNVEHYHDLGKLLFGWIVFWSYISFAQFFLTWYSNIPDEVAFFHKRWLDNGGTWQGVSIALVVMHFFVPFWFLMSRNIKRRLSLLAVGALCMVVMEVVDVYWVVMPNFGPFAPNWVDLACLLGVGGVYLAGVLRGMEDFPLVAVGDPRLVRALEFENA